MNMEFKKIFNPLKKCLGDGHNRQYFFRDLMAMITTVSEVEWGTELDPNTKRTNDNTINNFIKRGLSKTFAQSIVNRLTPERLEDQVNELPDVTRAALAKELSVYDDSINADNVGKCVADMMVDIITVSAGLSSEEEIAAKKEEIKSSKPKSESKAAINSTGTDGMDESDEIQAKSFLINHEKERELIPLCQIALLYSPAHKHIRSMYTEFILLPKRIQRYILKECGAEILADMDSLHSDESIDWLCDDLDVFELSSKCYLYMFDQYLYRAFHYYSECSIKGYDNYSFITLCKHDFSAIMNNDHNSLDKYIDDYLWMQDNKIKTEALPPMDYLWLEKDFGSCKEKDLTYWLCRFVIDACNNLLPRVKEKEFYYIVVNDQYAETQEDLYYCALNALYNLYLCHTITG